jgi:hypothetical protein
MSNRSVLLILSGIAVLAWGGLRLFGRYVPPHSLQAFVVFLLILSIACTSTFTPLAYVIGARLLSLRLYKVTIRHALRQGALLSLVLVFNLILGALHSWNIFTAIVILAAAGVVEVLSLARK